MEKAAFAEKNAPLYENALTDCAEIVLPVHVSPSSLELRVVAETDGKEPPMPEIDEIVKKSIPKKALEEISETEFSEILENGEENSEKNKPRFGYNDFGTVAHKALENRFSTDFKPIPLKLYDGIDDEKDIAKVKEICENMADAFEKSALFADCKAAASDENPILLPEFCFRSALDFQDEKGEAHTVIVSGSMDLVFKNTKNSPFKYTIVDYKTDRFMHKEKYIPQLSCYRRAVSDIFSCKTEEVRCVLYFLRYGCTEDISLECNDLAVKKELRRFFGEKAKFVDAEK